MVHGGLILAQLIRTAIVEDKELERSRLEAHMLQIKVDAATSMFETWVGVQSSLANAKIENYSKHLQWVLSALSKDRGNLQVEKNILIEEQFNSDTDDLRLAYLSKRISDIQIVLNNIRLEEQLCMNQTNLSISQVEIRLEDFPKLIQND